MFEMILKKSEKTNKTSICDSYFTIHSFKKGRKEKEVFGMKRLPSSVNLISLNTIYGTSFQDKKQHLFMKIFN